ncbi:MAG TPA: universal stress protein [Gemmatimonadales bacterium]|nr:universal stress protein [Gemmatimonadales bacterium]
MAWNPIIVGVDGSPESRGAVELAWTIAQAARAPLVPVHAVPDLWLAGDVQQPLVLPPDIYETLIQASRLGIERFLDGLVPPEVRAQLEVRTGSAATAIADVARRRRADLVVLGGKHHGALARSLGRSTAHYLVRAVDAPLLVTGPSPGRVARVLVAVDLSAASLPTITGAERFADLFGARLRVLHVVEPLRFTFLMVDTLDDAGFERRSRAVFERLVAPLKTVAPEDRVVRTGPAADTIADEAAAWHADLVVVGSHGKGWVDRLLVGSTTERLLHSLPASLLVIPSAGARRAATPRRRPPRRRRKGPAKPRRRRRS